MTVSMRKLVVYVLVVLVFGGLADGAPSDQHQPRHPTKAQYKLPKLFDFENFKVIFGRHYTNLVENLRRQKLYLASSVRVFLSAIDYKHGKASSYLGVNQFSDWTPREFRALFSSAADSVETKKEEPRLDLDETKRETSDIKVMEEKLAKLSADELTDSLHLIRESTKAVERSDKVASNNPNYEPIELMSYGLNEQTKANKEIPAKDSNLIDQIFNTVLGKVSEWFADQSHQRKDTLFEGNRIKRRKPAPDIVRVDHRDSGCLFEPRDQYSCGACYLRIGLPINIS